MRLILLLNLCFFACQQKSAQQNSRVDQKVGYKDLVLDQSLSYFKGKVDLVLYEEDICEASKEFSVSSTRYLTIGTSQLREVTLEFIKDSLYRTLLEKETLGLEGDGILAAYKSEFGEPTEQNKVEESGISYTQYKWDGKKHYITIVDRHTSMTIEYGSYPGLSRWTREWMACEDRKKKGLQGNL